MLEPTIREPSMDLNETPEPLTVTVHMTERQLEIIRRAVEWQHRFICGQTEIPDEIRFSRKHDPEEISELESHIKKVLFPELHGASHGFSHDPERYELWREIAHVLSEKNHKNDVYTSNTFRVSGQPLLQVEFGK